MEKLILFTESSRNIGGQELQLMQQMAVMQASGFRTVLACRFGSRVEEVARGKGLTVLPLGFHNSFDIRTILSLREWIARNSPLLAICHSGHDTNNLAVAARLIKKRPFLLRSRTYQPGRARAFSYNHLVDATMLPSGYLKGCLLANPKIQPERLHVVYPGIDFAALDQNASEPLPPPLETWLLRKSGSIIVHAAMLRGEKGHMTVLSALHDLRERWPDVRYVIAGEGVEWDRINNEIKRLRLESRVYMAGMISPVASLISRSDLLVMPSSYEPLGMAQIEALAIGVPVIASRTGGIPETVEHGTTGLLAEPHQVSAWTSALDEALSNPQRMRNLARAGREVVRQQFSSETNRREILRIAGLEMGR